MSDFMSDFSPDRTELQIESELKHVLGDSEPTKSWGGNETVMETTGSKMAFVEKEEPGTCRTSCTEWSQRQLSSLFLTVP